MFEEEDIKNNPGTKNFILKRPFDFMSNLENEFVHSVRMTWAYAAPSL